MGSGSEDKSKLEKLGRLCSALREHQAKCYEITEEIQKLLAGDAGIGATLKRLEHYFDGVWCHRYAPGESGRYVWAYAKDVPQLKRLLRHIDVEQLEGRIATYLRDDDPYYVKARHPFGLFAMNVNRFAPAPAPDLQLEAPTVPDCRHVPPCKSDQEHTKRRGDDIRRPF